MGLLGIDGIEQETILGRGAFGIVYKAWQPALQRPVAVKILVGAFDPVALRRFERECATIGSLSEEPGILTVYTAGHTPEGSPYLVMPYLAGGSLADRLHHGPLPTPEATAHGIAIARALAAAHDHGVLHLDIKPANILLDTQGRPHLADFGIARFIDTEQRGHTATVAGTPGFAAPEIFDGRQPTTRSDIYGLGATLHALAAGRTPFSLSAAGGLSGLLHQIAHQDPPDLRPHGVPDAYARIVERAMAKNPDDRYPTMAHLATALTQLTPTTHTPTPTTSPPPPDDLDPPTLDEHQLPPTPHPPPPRPPDREPEPSTVPDQSASTAAAGAGPPPVAATPPPAWQGPAAPAGQGPGPGPGGDARPAPDRPPRRRLLGVALGALLLVAVLGAVGVVLTRSDPTVVAPPLPTTSSTTPTSEPPAPTIPPPTHWVAPAFGWDGGTLREHVVLTSADGISWLRGPAVTDGRRLTTVIPDPATGGWLGVGVRPIDGTTDTNLVIARSEDLQEWTDADGAAGPGRIVDIARSDDGWVAVGWRRGVDGEQILPIVMASGDATTWSERIVPEEASDLAAVTFANGTWVAVGRGGVLVSTDGTSWSIVDPSVALTDVAADGAGTFVAVGGANTIRVSAGGQEWSTASVVESTGQSRLQSVATDGAGRWVTVGSWPDEAAPGSTPGLWTSADGLTWSRVVLEGVGGLFAVGHDPTGGWVAAGEAGLWSSADGVQWTPRPLPAGFLVTDLAYRP